MSPSPDPTNAHRRTRATITVRGTDGAPLVGTEVTVEQTRHAFGFGFGNIGFDLVALANGETGAAPDSPFGGAAEAGHLADLWFGLYDTATLPFYWGGFEPVRGEPDTTRMLAAARFFVERGARVKGHPLVWHTVTADWLRELSTDEVEAAQRDRIRREVTDFAGLVDTWDAINEVVIMPVFDNEEHRNGITRLCWERGRLQPGNRVRVPRGGRARGGDPGRGHRAAEPHAPGVLGRGADAGGARAVRPLRPAAAHDGDDAAVRRPDAPGDRRPERLPARALAPHARGRAAPGGGDGAALPDAGLAPVGRVDDLLGADRRRRLAGRPVGLVRSDGTPKPSYGALRDLVRGEWWLAPTTLRTGDDGTVEVEGWLGHYRVSAGGRSAAVSLTCAGTSAAAVTL